MTPPVRCPTGHPTVAVRAVDPSERSTIELIATRMRLTLAEVLDPTRADEMFTDAELIERVLWHLDRSDPDRRSEVFVAEDDEGSIVGHTMVRTESGDHVGDVPTGLFATTYVDPDARRRGVASALIGRGEQWMRDVGMATAMTFTDAGNTKLLALYEQHGYTCERIDTEWSRAVRRLDD